MAASMMQRRRWRRRFANDSADFVGDLGEFYVVDELGGGGRPERVLALLQACFTL